MPPRADHYPGIQAACHWLASVEKRLTVGGFNASHDDDALVRYAEAQARAAEDERQKLIGSIAQYNRRRLYGLLPPAPPEVTPQGETLSQRLRDYHEHLARSRNALSPPLSCIPLLAVSRWHYRPPMSLSVANHMALKAARRRAAAHGIEPPSPRLDESVQLAKLTCSQWWRRKLRRTAGRRLEQVQRESHRVHKRAGIYCSDMTVERRRSQKVRNRALLETLEPSTRRPGLHPRRTRRTGPGQPRSSPRRTDAAHQRHRGRSPPPRACRHVLHHHSAESLSSGA